MFGRPGGAAREEALMTDIEIGKAREEKKLYVKVLAAVLMVRCVTALLQAFVTGPWPATAILGLSSVLMLAALVVTWRFCRAIQMGETASAINALFSPFIFLIQSIFLLRSYARRTGITLTFLLGDRLPPKRMARPGMATAGRSIN
jgi:hypothetical protein